LPQDFALVQHARRPICQRGSLLVVKHAREAVEIARVEQLFKGREFPLVQPGVALLVVR
jgi:hypothetical protein